MAARMCLKSAFAGAGATVTALGMAALGMSNFEAHCQVPCGIYDDDGRMKTIKEDSTTIRKAISQVQEYARAPPGPMSAQNFNQMSRWVTVKEQHASDIIQTVSEYFLTQKVKPVPRDDPHYQQYCDILATHHSVMVAAMKTKQNSNLGAANDLDHAISHLESVYSKK